ncbi:MAG: hypothetical protein JWP35_2230 [Caulobacter sp.]|nr:hypothetical protein [Caulobacter sp.]
MAAPQPDGMAEHEARTVEDVARVHREHYAAASGLQRAADRATSLIGRPIFGILLVVAVAAWAAIALLHGGGVTSAVFGWLELSATLLSLMVAVLILSTQRREDELSERRDQLTLELGLLADQRSAKIISLLEELRRDAPGLADRADPQSDAMQTPADPDKILKAIDARRGDKR